MILRNLIKILVSWLGILPSPNYTKLLLTQVCLKIRVPKIHRFPGKKYRCPILGQPQLEHLSLCCPLTLWPAHFTRQISRSSQKTRRYLITTWIRSGTRQPWRFERPRNWFGEWFGLGNGNFIPSSQVFCDRPTEMPGSRLLCCSGILGLNEVAV